jgi:BMFP domain-containing protein YqiC
MSALIFNKLAELERRIAALEKALAEQALKRGPGRPRKTDGHPGGN